MSDKLFIKGLMLVSLAMIATAFSIYLVIFTVPIYVMGVLNVFNSQKTIAIKLLTLIAPMLLWLPTAYAFYYLCTKLY